MTDNAKLESAVTSPASDTPKTDEEVANRGYGLVDLARQLERELATAKSRLAEAINDREQFQLSVDEMRQRYEAEREKHRLIEAQYSRLCDEVYEEDGETLRIVAERKAKENEEARSRTLVNAAILATDRVEAAEARLAEVERHSYAAFFNEVCARAERAMLTSHKLEGMHFLAMKQVKAEWDAAIDAARRAEK